MKATVGEPGKDDRRQRPLAFVRPAVFGQKALTEKKGPALKTAPNTTTATPRGIHLSSPPLSEGFCTLGGCGTASAEPYPRFSGGALPSGVNDWLRVCDVPDMVPVSEGGTDVDLDDGGAICAGGGCDWGGG